jgi:hypothetical protein
VDSLGGGFNDFEEMSMRSSRGEQIGKSRHQATSNGFGRPCRQKGGKYPPRVAKYNVHGYDLLGVKWQGFCSSPQTIYPDVRHCEELVDFIDKKGSPKKTFILTSMIKCTFVHDEFETEYIGLYTHQQMINNCMYDQISYNCLLSNAFKLNVGHYVILLLVEMIRATGKKITNDVI